MRQSESSKCRLQVCALCSVSRASGSCQLDRAEQSGPGRGQGESQAADRQHEAPVQDGALAPLQIHQGVSQECREVIQICLAPRTNKAKSINQRNINKYLILTFLCLTKTYNIFGSVKEPKESLCLSVQDKVL